MSIVFFCRYFYPHIGGVEKHVLKISQILKKKHHITVITEQYNKSLPLSDEFEGILIRRIPYAPDNTQKKYAVWDYLFKNREMLVDSDIIHIHDVFYWYVPFRFMYPSKKVFMTFHGYEGNDLPGKKAILSHKVAEVLSKGNICIGDYLKKWYNTRPDVVTYGAIDAKRRVGTVSVLSAKSKIHILYIGRLEEEAGIMEYLRLTKRLVKRGYKPDLLVLGDGSLRKKAENYVKQYHLPVSFRGFVSDVEKFLPNSHVVFTSRFLGTMEAMNYKKPVFCIYNNAIKRDCFAMSPFGEFIYLSDSISELFRMFEQMLSDEKQALQKRNAAYSWVKHETWQNMANQYLKLWNK